MDDTKVSALPAVTPATGDLVYLVDDPSGTALGRGATVDNLQIFVLTSGTVTGTITVPNTGLHILDSDASHDLIISPGSNLTADRILTLTTGDAARTVTLSGNLTVEAASLINQDLTSDSSVAQFTKLGLGVAPLTELDNAGRIRSTGKATAVLTGTIDPAASTTVTGVGTLFTTELVVGDRITVTAETRTVTAIASDTSLTVDTAFSDNAQDLSPDVLYAIATYRNSANATKFLMNDQGKVALGSGAPTAGVSYPAADLHVLGSIRLEATEGDINWFAGTTHRATFDDQGTQFVIGSIAAIALNFIVENGSAMFIATSKNVGINETVPDYKLDVNGTFGFTPGTSVTPVDNGDVVIEATNNTTLTLKLKGSDGTVRSGTITLS